MRKLVNIWKKMLYILNRPQKLLCVIVFVLTCLGSGFECLGVSVIIPVVNMILDPEQLLNSSIAQKFSLIVCLEYNELIILTIGGVIGVYLFKNAFFIFLSWIRIKFACKIQREVSIHMMESYMSRGYQFFLQKNYGELNRGISNDTVQVYQVLYAGFRFLSDFITIILICIFMFFADWELSLMLAFMSGMCLLLIYCVFRKNMYKAGIKYSTFAANAAQASYEAFEGIKDVLILRKQRHFVESYENNQIQMQLAQSKQIIGAEAPAYIIEGLCVSGLLAMVAVRVIGGDRSADFIAVLAAFAIGAFRILPSLGRISASLNQVLGSIPGVDSVYNNLVETNQYAMHHPEQIFVQSASSGIIAKTKKKEKNSVSYNNRLSFETSLTLNNITFRYNDNTDNILEHMNLEVKKGQSVALIGSSGVGKSTLADIMLGLLVPQEGTILIDGTDITKIPDEWASLVGYVPQTVFLTSGSIKENIAFGEEIDEIDEELVRDALERAELLEFIDTLPNGINTTVGDRGIRLSGGQRQRIAIARALYHRPEIMVLDEATSALDNETEAAVMSAIDALQGQVTLVIVAHRLTTIKNCDVIYEVVDKAVKIRNKEEVLGEHF
ncbi:MAG: ATP-binding cassette domain-containing protein [Ruminococcus sp.]|nr:ATP-binding cassette domain-containing protein [Ruminococcus sp.]